MNKNLRTMLKKISDAEKKSNIISSYYKKENDFKRRRQGTGLNTKPGEGTRDRWVRESIGKTDEELFQLLYPNWGKCWGYNPRSIPYLELISNELGVPVQHAEKGGEKGWKCVVGFQFNPNKAIWTTYWVDGYLVYRGWKINLEVDERHHKYQIYEDMRRQNCIEVQHKTIFFRMVWSDIENEVWKVINNIKNLP